MIAKTLLALRIIINILIVPMLIIVTYVIVNNICGICFDCNFCVFYSLMVAGIIVFGIPIYWVVQVDTGYTIVWIPTILISAFGLPTAIFSIKLICIIMWNLFVDIGNILTPIVEKIFIT